MEWAIFARQALDESMLITLRKGNICLIVYAILKYLVVGFE